MWEPVRRYGIPRCCRDARGDVWADSAARPSGRRVHYFHVTCTNYVVATLVALVWVAAQGDWAASPLVYWVGALNGVGFGVLIVLQYFMLRQRGVGVTFALGSLSLLAPITTSLVVFGEPAEALTLSGIALLVVAAPLIAYRRMPPASRGEGGTVLGGGRGSAGVHRSHAGLMEDHQ